MRVFVPMSDELLDASPELYASLVPYRPGFALCPPLAPAPAPVRAPAAELSRADDQPAAA
jgi:hypothetical protein